MTASEVWVAKEDGSDLIRAASIMTISRDYTGTIAVRLSGGEASALTLVTVASHEGKHTPEDFHRQLIRVLATQLSDPTQAAMIRPVWDDNGWRWITEPL
ncbi:MAG TPA: hypothetical protein VK784_11745 [Pseudonocardiaceae bacterium]|nr:hypothetical protein [Pseudonocardiaceae bacterium]